jgi:CheY-like chemotaxis protein
VLVVSDQPAARSRLQRLLQTAGYTARTAISGPEALDAVAQSIPGAIVLRLQAPIIDGSAFLAQLRGLPAGAEIPVLVISTFPLPQLAATYGVTVLLTRFREAALLEQVRRLLPP